MHARLLGIGLLRLLRDLRRLLVQSDDFLCSARGGPEPDNACLALLLSPHRELVYNEQSCGMLSKLTAGRGGIVVGSPS